MHCSAFLLAIVLYTAAVCLGAPSDSELVKRAAPFAGDPAIDVKGILAAAKRDKGNVMATFPSRQESGKNVKIFGDWQKLKGVSAMHFFADMDVDCDGVAFKCPHNEDGQPQTSFGRLDATKVPWYVIPASFHKRNAGRIRPNSLGAIICGGKLFYGIFGDENGARREVIGEASLLLARTCFPGERLDGGTGHDALDVLYIMFGQDVPRGVGTERIDLGALKRLGDQQTRKLAGALRV